MQEGSSGSDLPRTEIRISARYVGERIDTRLVRGYEVVSRSPLLIRVGESGWAGLLRYGVIVTIGVEPAEEDVLLADLTPHVSRPHRSVESEEITATVDAGQPEGMDVAGRLWIQNTEAGRLGVIVEVFAKSTALSHYESEVQAVFDEMEPLVESVREGHRAKVGQRRLLAQLGEALKTQARVIGRVEVTEKPDLTWDDPVLYSLYEHLSNELELEDRDRVLTRKTDFLSQSAGLLLDMAQQRQTLRVEWYIVILIVIEIVLLVWDMVWN